MEQTTRTLPTEIEIMRRLFAIQQAISTAAYSVEHYDTVEGQNLADIAKYCSDLLDDIAFGHKP